MRYQTALEIRQDLDRIRTRATEKYPERSRPGSPSERCRQARISSNTIIAFQSKKSPESF